MPSTTATTTIMESPASKGGRPERALKGIFSLPSHISPALDPVPSPHGHPADFDLHEEEGSKQSLSQEEENEIRRQPPGSLISPAFTPPSTPGTATPNPHRIPRSVPVDSSTSDGPGPQLVEKLPWVSCSVRARIPTTTGTEVWLHVYENDQDEKEHLAIVFGPTIRSKSLDAERPGETEYERLVRGAYTGRLHPGRTSSRIDEIRKDISAQSASVGSLSTIIEQGTQTSRIPGEIVKNRVLPADIPLVRIHSECYTGETIGSARCDCGEQLDEAGRLASTSSAGGVICYLRQEGRGIGLKSKLEAYNLQDLGYDTYEANLLLNHPADARSYGLATAILLDLGLGGAPGINLLTNNPDKVRAVEGPNKEITVARRTAMVPISWRTGGQSGINSEEIEKYLSTKIERFKHMIG